jgi:uncharacterized protein YcfJ
VTPNAALALVSNVAADPNSARRTMLAIIGVGIAALVAIAFALNVRVGPHEHLQGEVVSVHAVQTRYGRNREEAGVRLSSGSVVSATVRPEHSPVKIGAVVPVSVYRRLITRNVSYAIEGKLPGAES